MIIKEMMMFVASYVLVLVMFFLLMQFLSNGFFSKFIRVKISRGRFILVKIFAVDNTYYTHGAIDEGFIVFKDRSKEARRLSVDRGDVYRAIGVGCLDVDDVTNAIIKIDGTMVEGTDAIKMDHLNKRCLMKPTITNKKDQMKLALLFLVILGALGIVLYMLYTVTEDMVLLKNAVESLKAGVESITSTVGSV